jgi:signal recognition particle subunit SRP19
VGVVKVLWPLYFERTVSRSQGRRVKREVARDDVTLADIERALKSLGLKYTVEEGKAHPTRWWKAEGRVVVETEMAKERLLDKVAAKLPRRQ